MQNYKRYPLSFVSGKGSYLTAKNGDTYLDFMSGVAVNALGHAHPVMVKAIQKQAETLIHVSNYYEVPEQEKLATKLCEITGFSGAFFCNSGAEANEAAPKLARKHTGRKVFVSFNNSFHGRTFGSLSVTGKPAIQKDFLPLVPTVRSIDFGDEKQLEDALQEDTAAIIFELIQAEGGINLIEKAFLQKIMSIAKKKGILVIIDEVQTGVGRTGTFLLQEQFGIRADITTLAKGLGGGVPVGAILASEKVAKSFTAGSHGSTFGGTPFIMSVSLAVIKEISKPSFQAKLSESIAYFTDALKKLQKEFPKVFLALKGKGFLMGLEMPSAEKRDALILLMMKKYKTLVIGAGEKTLRILPPLTASKKDIDLFIKNLKSAVREI